MFGGSRAHEGTDPEQGVGGEPVSPRMIEPLDGCDQPEPPLLIAIYVPGMVHDRKAAEGALFGDLAVEVSVEPPGVEVDHKTRWVRQPNGVCTCATPGSMHTSEV